MLAILISGSVPAEHLTYHFTLRARSFAASTRVLFVRFLMVFLLRGFAHRSFSSENSPDVFKYDEIHSGVSHFILVIPGSWPGRSLRDPLRGFRL